ncbi:O-antigen ligase family protein [Microbacterium sp. 179-B 1A2 NHS]|uniref:O-antigen ligase family protein n=1 Tax=Microbacterium sp. 179-B 1A2 NHS TaxID=3142383 RepID=UPI0039A2E47D
MLTVYIVLLYGFPSSLSIAVLGSFGRPQFLWGLVLLAWWLLARLQPVQSTRSVSQPVRVALGILLIACLLSFAQAMLRGQPVDQISPAVSAVARMLSWSGVVLVAMDGIRSMGDLMSLVRRLALAGTLVAVIGLLQFITKQPIVDVLSAIPGFTANTGGIDSRGGFVRPAGTATHPLEYATAIAVALPLSIACAIIGEGGRKRARWWIPVITVTLASFLAVSRSAVIGLMIAVVAVIPGLPARFRPGVLGIVTIAFGAAMVAVPGLYGTIVGMFLGVGEDSSALSRTAALDLLPIFVASSPLFGAGIGTFLPRYYIFDNQWAQMAAEIGIIGVLSFAGLLAAAVWSAWRASRRSELEDLQVAGRCLCACVVTVGVLFALFDGLAFPISAGTAFLIVGLCAAARTVGMSDDWVSTAGMAADVDRELPPTETVPVSARVSVNRRG